MGIKLMNFTSFSEYVNAGGFIQKTVPRPPSYTPNEQTTSTRDPTRETYKSQLKMESRPRF